MTPSDAEGIKALFECLGHYPEKEVVEAGISRIEGNDNYFASVCEMDGKVVGFIEGQRYDLIYGDRGWNVISLAVDVDCRRNGIGALLVKALEDHAKEDGASFVRLNSRVDRKDAHAFYESLGYVVDKTQSRLIKTL